MSQKQFNTFSFNNFKAFGEKMQTFTKKPITLVYGPNSIGKSSLLHAKLYYEYLDNISVIEKSSAPILYCNYTFFAGNEFNPGGFENFIHKKNIKNTINYKVKFTTTESISKIFPESYKTFRNLVEDGLKGLLNKLDSMSIFSRISNYQQKEGFYYLTKFLLPADEKTLIDMFIKDNSLDNSKINIEEIIREYKDNELTLVETVCRKDGQSLDALDKALILFLDNTTAKSFYENIDVFKEEVVIKSLTKTLKFYADIGSIKDVSLVTKVYEFEDKLFLENKFFINEELIFKVDIKNSQINYTIFYNNKFMKDMYYHSENTYIKIKDKRDSFSRKDKDILKENIEHQYKFKGMDLFFINHHLKTKDDYHVGIEHLVFDLSLKCFLMKERNTVQYIGPLRWLPDREELEQNKNHKINPYENISNEEMAIKNQAPESHRHIINKFKSKKNKKSGNTSRTSETMWMDFIESEEIQKEINLWLGDKNKLKSTYKVELEKDIVDKSFFGRLLKKPSKNRLNFIDQRTDTSVSIRDMGLGISQVLPVLISSKMTENTKMILEQPELHLHPSVQAELADEFIKSYKNNNNEFMIETHSEHLLLRIMKRMRHTAEDKEGRDKTLDLTPVKRGVKLASFSQEILRNVTLSA